MIRSARVGLLALLFVVVMAMASAAEEPKYKVEDLSAVGKPEGFKKGLSSRYALWFEDDTWHVRTTSNEKGPHAFARMIESIGGKITSMARVGIEGGGAQQDGAAAGSWNTESR